MKRALKIAGAVLALAVVLLLLFSGYVLLVWDRPVDRPVIAMTARRDSATVARGEYLFKTTWQCWGCHQAEPRGSNLPPSGAGVFDLRTTGPGFGVFYSANISPDSATGIGGWSDGEIVRAIREGVRRDGRVLFPIMPVDWLHGLSDEDALALVSYLRSIPAVRNSVPANEPSFFAETLLALNVISPPPPIENPVVAPPATSTLEYGRYLATSAAGCADCHTPRNLQNGEFYLDSLFTGSSILFGEAEGEPLLSYARNIRPDSATGIGHWGEEDFIRAVTAGYRPDGTALDPHMPYPQYKNINPADLHAIYLYLRSLPPISRTMPRPKYSSAVAASAAGVDRGRLLFDARCRACHGDRGTASDVTSVRLAEATPLYTDDDLRNFVGEGQIELKMPGFSRTLSPSDLNDIIAYIRTWERQ